MTERTEDGACAQQRRGEIAEISPEERTSRLNALSQRLMDPDGFDRAALAMREGATLKLDRGEELRVNVGRDDLEQDEIVVRRSAEGTQPLADRLAVLDDIIATGRAHPARTTDAWLAHDREH
jgi:hypothetical protein